MKCKICGKEFRLNKENRYLVQNVSLAGLLNRNYHEAFDCPFCGCQNIVNERYLNADEEQQYLQEEQEENNESNSDDEES